jgi:thiamine-monophosphate kinase
MPQGPATIVGVGDDAAVLSAPDSRVVATTDILVDGRHFRREWSSAVEVGGKAAAQNLADIAAMGARPTGLLVGLAAPGDLPLEWAEGLADGLAREAARAGASVVGGDISSSPTIMVAVTALGDLEGRSPVRRSGARPGDVVAVAGVLGHSAAGLALLEAAVTPGPAADSAAAALMAEHRWPQPDYAAGPEAARLGATSMIDVSDGLLQDLGHVAADSGVRIDLESALLGEDQALRDAAGALGDLDPLDWVLTGGEDHALAATFPLGTPLPDRWVAVGRVWDGQGVRVDARRSEGRSGWDHFR